MRVPIAALGIVLLTGCVEPFSGSHIQLVMGRNVTSPCNAISSTGLVAPVKCSGDEKKDRFLYHYELWATVRRSAIVYLASFTVQNQLQTDDQLQFELFKLERDGVLLSGEEDRPFKIGVERYFSELSKDEQSVALNKMHLVAPKLSVTSFSTKMFQEGKKLHKDFYVGNYSQLTFARNGSYFGQILSTHPFGPGTIGGGDIKVEASLADLDSLWVTIENKDPNRPKPKPSSLVYLRGTAYQVARGSYNVEANSPSDSTIDATFGVYSELGEEEYF